MKRVRISIQIALSLAVLSITVILVARAIGLVPDKKRAALTARIAICENLAVTSSLLTSRQQWDALTVCLQELKARNPDVISAGLRRQDGRLLAEAGEHKRSWLDTTDRRSTDSHVYVPILLGKTRWGSLEVAFQPLGVPGWPEWLDPAELRLIGFVAAANALIYVIYLGKMLYDLDPARVMPKRVRSALDALSEGLLVLDNDGRIVMANQAFATGLGRSAENLLGTQASRLPWKATPEKGPPWEEVRKTKNVCLGVEMAFCEGPETGRTFLVNASPIEDSRGEARGVLASFADITQLEQKKQELLKMLEALRESRDKIRQQNDELAYLATRDSLTGCLNRRSFFEQFEGLWRSTKVARDQLSCLMVDIDKFKAINDNFGHSTGDEVLKRVAAVLRQSVGTSGLVCRYGGEEFCVLLVSCTLDHAAAVAEILRTRIAGLEFRNLQVTASLGVSGGALGSASCQELLDQADKSLYYSKRNGRNQVSRWDQMPADYETPELDPHRSQPPPLLNAGAVKDEPLVPYYAVASLMCALAYRDPETACHSARVADLAVATARGLMSAGDAYLLEIAALLHDIGKIGVPDSILLKPGPLSPDEWQIMQLHARIGVEIVHASFRCQTLVDIVRFHHAMFGGNAAEPGMPAGHAIPLGARIVSIADAYDAMVTNRVYRKGRSSEEAIAELRRMAHQQFDPELVERFVEVVAHRRGALPESLGPVSKDLALSLGLQTERLAAALDANDLTTIRAIGAHLKSTAEANGLASLAEAAELLQASAGDSDVKQMVEVIHDIIDLSLSAQQAYLSINSDMAQVALARSQFVAGEPAVLTTEWTD